MNCHDMMLTRTQIWFDLSWIHTRTQSVFSSFFHMRISVLEVMSVYLIHRYQNATLARPMPLHELKKSTLRLKRFTLMTQGSTVRLKTPCTSDLSLSGGVGSERKHCSLPLALLKNAWHSSLNSVLKLMAANHK